MHRFVINFICIVILAKEKVTLCKITMWYFYIMILLHTHLTMNIITESSLPDLIPPIPAEQTRHHLHRRPMQRPQKVRKLQNKFQQRNKKKAVGAKVKTIFK